MFQPGFNELRETKVKDSGTFAFDSLLDIYFPWNHIPEVQILTRDPEKA